MRKQIKKYITKGKNMSKVNNQTLKELKDAIELINENITQMRKTIKENHQEVMTKIEQVEKKTTEIALELAKNNEIEINDISKDYNEFKKECNPKHLNNLTERIKKLETQLQDQNKNDEVDRINKLETQLQDKNDEIENLKNRSLRNTLIFKNLPEENNETWEDTCTVLTKFIHSKLDLPYDKEFIDGQISRAHRGGADNFRNEGESENQWKGPKPIFAQIGNWRLAEEIKTEIIKLHAQKRTKVTVNQMYSKQLTLKRRYEMMKNDKTIQVKLDFPAVLKSKKRGTRGNWRTVERF